MPGEILLVRKGGRKGRGEEGRERKGRVRGGEGLIPKPCLSNSSLLSPL
jgi:hypothetical protein